MLKETLMKKISNENKQQLNASMERLMGKYMDALLKHSPSLDMLLKEYFQIPQNVLLPENQAQEQQFTEEELNSIDNEISTLKIQYRKAHILSLKHSEELKVLQCISSMENQCKDFSTNTACKNSSPVLRSKCNKTMNICDDVVRRTRLLVPGRRNIVCKKYRALKKRYHHLNLQF